MPKKSPKIRFHRSGIDPGLAGVEAWIARWYEEPSDFRIRQVTIARPARLSYEAVQQRNETPLHAYLKCLASAHLGTIGVGRQKPQYEMQMYFPFRDLLEGVRVIGSTFDPSRPQVIAKGRTDVFCAYGDTIYVDVYVNKLSAEVGYTEPYNLCMPLLEGLVKRAFWVPFPPKLDPKNFDPQRCELETFVAYEFTASPSSNF